MFRSANAPGPYDDLIAKATDEKLTSEDWGAIIEVCDKVASDAGGPNKAIQGVIKRLAHRNANVQLYTLELANALSQNCGKAMHRELASRAFTDALLRLANDRNVHQQVKAKILERMKEWADMFSKDADLGIMYDAYFRLKQSNPTLHPPSAPQKNRLTEMDRQKEDDELQIALKLSLQEEEKKKAPAPTASTSAAPASGSEPAAAAPVDQAPSHSTGTTAATVSRVRALYDFTPSEPGELEFRRGDVIAVLESVYKDWWRGSLKGKTGIFPLNYVEKLTDPTPDDLQREAQMEAEVFAEIKNVEKLLTLLSTSNPAPREEDNEEISKLYHQTLAIRPKLIKLIEKYSQKKDDFTQLNEKFIKARRDYEALLESSMAHPPQPTYHQYAPRPPMPQGYPGPGGPMAATPGPGYAPQAVPGQQEPQRYYTPGPQGPPPPQEQNTFQATSPPPNFQRQTPAPFYLQGAEVPAQGPQAPNPAPLQPQQQLQSQPPQQQYPPRDQQTPMPLAPLASNPPGPVQTSSPPPPQAYQAYPGSTAPQQYPSQRPQNTYGNPSELAAPGLDSPVSSFNPATAPTYSTDPSYVPPQQQQQPQSPVANKHQFQPNAPAPSGPPQGVPTPLAIHPPQQLGQASQPQAQAPSAPAPAQPQYLAYNPNMAASSNRPQPPQQPEPQNSYDALPPPQPTQQAPLAPLNPNGSTVSLELTPPPLNLPSHNPTSSPPPPVGGPAGYDARQGLPSQMASPPQQPQYKAYVPPAAAGGEGPSAPQDFYRQGAY